ncbi:MAG: RDD family protein [Deltaproteobacteria bacterium]|nr:RDD family protein [Deltaproteobacteria bacterium]
MISSRTNSLTIKTPEGVTFSMLLAGPVTRFLAWLFDAMVIIALSQTVGKLLAVLEIISRDLASAVSILGYFFISIGYGIVMEWYWRGQTLGKHLFRLRVMDAQGLRLTFSQIVMRNLLRFVDSLPAMYLVGGLACLLSSRAQRLGDLAANTVVIRHPKVYQPDLTQILADKYNSFHDYPHLEARLRQKVLPGEARVALQAIMRRDYLDPAARVTLFHEVADHFRNLVQFPPEAINGISDEQYVRNIVGALFRSSN